MKKNKDVIKDDDSKTDSYGINLTFVLSTYKVVIELDDKYQLDLRKKTRHLRSNHNTQQKYGLHVNSRLKTKILR